MDDEKQRRVVVFTGLPGTGKSALADRVAASIGAPAFAGDWLMGALKPYGVLDHLDRSTYLAMYYNLLNTLVIRQLMLGQSAVVDCLVDDAVAARWQDSAARYDTRLLVVECVCTRPRPAPLTCGEPHARHTRLARSRLGPRRTHASRVPTAHGPAHHGRRGQLAG